VQLVAHAVRLAERLARVQNSFAHPTTPTLVDKRDIVMEQRTAEIHRQTKETDVTVELNLDGVGQYEIDSGIGFLDHMLTHLSKHSRIDLVVKAKGDLNVDAHHTVEDIAICLGECLLKALGDKKGIARYGHSSLPMEDALANVSVDLSGRASCVYNVEYRTDKIGDFDVECLEEMLRSLASNGKFNLHVNVPYGTNSHHIAEAIFKGLGKALGAAVRVCGTDVPSTKGTL
jgi:imidazoleglycerol-phosphate dehydratase